MKIAKSLNPLNLAIGQVWESKDPRRINTFRIRNFEKQMNSVMENDIFVLTQYLESGNTSKINIKRFNTYRRVK